VMQSSDASHELLFPLVADSSIKTRRFVPGNSLASC